MTLSPPLQPLAAYRRWVNWVAIPDPDRPGKTTKRPMDVRTGLYCKAVDPAHQYSYVEAAATGSPVGFVFNDADGFWFLDMDGCLASDGNGGYRWSALASELCGLVSGAAIETSQSGTGLHAIGRGACPAHSCRNITAGLELYTHDRFVALTDKGTIGNAATDLSAAIADVAQRWFPPNPHGDIAGWTSEPVCDWGGPEDDAELLRAALASGKKNAQAAFGTGHVAFADLWNADTDALSKKWPPDPNSNDLFNRSHADAALASHLAYWTGKNCERIRALMWGSALARAKWEDRPEWLDTTILRAASVVTNVAQARPAMERQQAMGSWEEPDLSILDGPQITAPPFPRVALRADWALWCERTAEGANAPYDYTATALLTVAAALIGNARVIAASESWAEPALLWAALVGGPSAGKSPALDPLAKMITALEADLAASFESTDHAYQSAAQIAKAHCEQWEGDPARH